MKKYFLIGVFALISYADIAISSHAGASKPEGFIFIGNPGVGKSKIIDSLIGNTVTKSKSTSFFSEYKHNGKYYIDTPGLATKDLQRQVGEEIKKTLEKDDRDYKIFFVMNLKKGQVTNEDLAALETVIDAIEYAGCEFNIIINKMTENEQKVIFGDPVAKANFDTRIRSGKYKTESIHFIYENEEISKGKIDLITISKFFNEFIFITSKMAHIPSLCAVFVSIPGGTYEIGSPSQDADRQYDEKFHSIQLSEFSIMDAAVTQESYARIMGKNPSKFKEQKYCPRSYKEINVKGIKISVCADHPVEMVSWDDAKNFAEILSKQDRKYQYNLPTEAQLEVAFRGRTKTAFVTGRDDEIGLGDYVWYSKNSGSQTQPVKSKLANSFGIYRSSVWEWAHDWYDREYVGSTGLDPQGAVSGEYRVSRGGSWTNGVEYCRSANRHDCPVDFRGDCVGFRLVRK
jgi:formylglycine-generating enzyme required for sulfatase activity